MGILLVAQTVVAASTATLLLVLICQYIVQRPLRVVPGPPSPSWITGNFKQMFSTTSSPFHDELTKRYGKVATIDGMFGDKMLVISDTKALHSILIKDQPVFEPTNWFAETNRLTLGPGLLSKIGAAHRKQRKILNPAFSVAHMRRLVPMFQSLTKELQNILRSEVADGPREIDVLEWMGKLALELIAQAALGYSFNALQGSESKYATAFKSYGPTLVTVQIWRRWLPYLTAAVPAPVLRVLAHTVPWTNLRALVDVADKMQDGSKEVWEQKKALATGDGKDLMSILLKANGAADDNDRLPDDELLGQMTTLLFGGTDTTSTALARILHVLASHPDAQEKLRAELADAGGAQDELDHDALHALPYLEAVCRETLRLFPPITFVQRRTGQDFLLPLAHPFRGTDGKEHTELLVPTGTTVVVNIPGVNRDPDIWGVDAHEWKPERWVKALPESVAGARIPGVYLNQLTFLGGGRACIGFKFSQLEMKVVLAQLLPVFRFGLPTKKEIVWRWGGIVTPSVAGSTEKKPCLPMTVSLV